MENEALMYFGMIADEETLTGFLLASLGNNRCAEGSSNFFIANKSTSFKLLVQYFKKLYTNKHIAILLLSEEVAERLSNVLVRAKRILPIILTIPRKDEAAAGSKRQRMSLADVAAFQV